MRKSSRSQLRDPAFINEINALIQAGEQTIVTEFTVELKACAAAFLQRLNAAHIDRIHASRRKAFLVALDAWPLLFAAALVALAFSMDPKARTVGALFPVGFAGYVCAYFVQGFYIVEKHTMPTWERISAGLARPQIPGPENSVERTGIDVAHQTPGMGVAYANALRIGTVSAITTLNPLPLVAALGLAVAFHAGSSIFTGLLNSFSGPSHQELFDKAWEAIDKTLAERQAKLAAELDAIVDAVKDSLPTLVAAHEREMARIYSAIRLT